MCYHVNLPSDASALYGLVDANLSNILSTIENNIIECLEARTFKDKSRTAYERFKPVNIVTGVQIFKPIAVLFSE